MATVKLLIQAGSKIEAASPIQAGGSSLLVPIEAGFLSNSNLSKSFQLTCTLHSSSAQPYMLTLGVHAKSRVKVRYGKVYHSPQREHIAKNELRGSGQELDNSPPPQLPQQF